MSLPAFLRDATVSPLARQFARFCHQLDPRASDTCLATAAWLAECNLAGDTCLDLERQAGQPLWRDDTGTARYRAPAASEWKAQLSAAFIGRPGDYQPLILDGRRLYLHRHWHNELRIVQALEGRMQPVPVAADRLARRLDALFGDLPSGQGGWWQKCAAAMALTRRLTIISGGPGTGKTTTVTRILALLLEQEPTMRILLAAPTGKAAARLSESIAGQKRHGIPGVARELARRLPEQAATLHRLLGWSPGGFRHHADNPLTCDCLIVDECSMIDQELMAELLAALPADCRLILMGDRNQLASVEAGSVFGDLTGSGMALGLSPQRAEELRSLLGTLPQDLVRDGLPSIADCIAELRHSFRFAAGGGIGRLAAHISSGQAEAAVHLLAEEANEELSLIPLSASPQAPRALLDWMLDAYRPMFEASDAEGAIACLEQARVLCALRAGPWGEQELGTRFRERLQREGLMNESNGPAHGLPLLILHNDYETGLFNGDTGIFWRQGDELLAWFPGEDGLRALVPAQLPAWQPAWTLTVHRSQGSEYQRVLLVLPPKDSPILCRELIYTGITRARTHCTLACDPALIRDWARKTADRQSGLAQRLGFNSCLIS